MPSDSDEFVVDPTTGIGSDVEVPTDAVEEFVVDPETDTGSDVYEAPAETEDEFVVDPETGIGSDVDVPADHQELTTPRPAAGT